MRSNSAELFAGLDIGGTKIHGVLATANGEIIGSSRKRTRGEQGFASVMKRTAICFEEACAEAGVPASRVRAVGIGAPSAIRADGTAVHAPNLGWRNAPIEDRLSRLLKRPVFAANDCDLGTLGEYVYGAGKGSNTLAGLFVGTGLGGGIVCHGKLLRGENRMAAELGHMVVAADGRRCGCGRRGCLEAYASKAGMARRFYEEIRKRNRRSILAKEEGDFASIRSSVLRNAYCQGDRLVREIVDEAARFLGIGVANLITMLGPSKIVLGGGVMEALGREVLKIVRDSAQAHAFPPESFRNTRIMLSLLGDDAVALGAVAYARDLAAGKFGTSK